MKQIIPTPDSLANEARRRGVGELQRAARQTAMPWGIPISPLMARRVCEGAGLPFRRVPRARGRSCSGDPSWSQGGRWWSDDECSSLDAECPWTHEERSLSEQRVIEIELEGSWPDVERSSLDEERSWPDGEHSCPDINAPCSRDERSWSDDERSCSDDECSTWHAEAPL